MKNKKRGCRDPTLTRWGVCVIRPIHKTVKTLEYQGIKAIFSFIQTAI